MISIHVDHEYANKTKGDCRKRLADLVCLALRDEVDIITGDFSQAGGYLGEVVFHAVMYHERGNNLPEGTKSG